MIHLWVNLGTSHQFFVFKNVRNSRSLSKIVPFDNLTANWTQYGRVKSFIENYHPMKVTVST